MNASSYKFTLMDNVTISISRTPIRIKFYFVYSFQRVYLHSNL